MLEIETLHHVSLPVSDLARSRRFYGGLLGLMEIPRPPFSFAGAWYQIGDRQLHLIVSNTDPTFRRGKPADSRDVHTAIRVRSFRRALEHLHAAGYHPAATDPALKTKESPSGTVGYPQVFLLDPDHHTIEINADQLDS
ncbi:MAG: VOC family protein [Gemmatimonadota bacterium]